MHGKVKLARSLETGDYVAIKIIQRFSKKRRLGRVTVSPEDKTKREIAILKKIRHPNVVGLLEVIDDPDYKKIYMVLEHVELGEIVWRKKGAQQICIYERRRFEQESRGEKATKTDEENQEKYFQLTQQRRERRDAMRARMARKQSEKIDHWSLEHGMDDEPNEEMAPLSRQDTNFSEIQNPGTFHETPLSRSTQSSRGPSRATSKTPSKVGSRAHTPLPAEFDIGPDSDNEVETLGAENELHSAYSSAVALEGSMFGGYADDTPFRMRSPSTVDSVISHMSSVDEAMPHDAFEDDFSYVPCFTLDQARSAFRDTVLGLEYLHYQGVVHRDIKPANLLWTKDHRVKISDFGVSYFGRPIREGEPEEYVPEEDARDFDDDLELAKTVGTPAFFAPELCYTDLDVEQPKVTEQIDVWSLGVTLYCLVFARLPFLAEDEYQLFRTIAQQEVYIPRRRLKAVDPSYCSSHMNLSKRQGPTYGEFRDENELRLENIDDDLYDLLFRMLIKDPTKRIKLREVKRHPWVLQGIDNRIAWLDDTDPSRNTGGRRIQVDDRELERAVVPLTFLDRARSVVKKTIGKVLGATTRSSERCEGGSRRRALSSATSSAGEPVFSHNHGPIHNHGPATTPLRDLRRASLRGDEPSYFTAMREPHEPTEHPLAQSVVASPEQPVTFEDPFAQSYSRYGRAPTPNRQSSGHSTDHERPAYQDRTVSASDSIQTVVPRVPTHSHSASTPAACKVPEQETISNASSSSHSIFTSRRPGLRHKLSRDIREEYMSEGLYGHSRNRSNERALFHTDDKHGEASLAITRAVAPGSLEPVETIRESMSPSSTEPSPKTMEFPKTLHSPAFFQPSMLAAHFAAQSAASSPGLYERNAISPGISDLYRPQTAHKVEARTPAERVYGASTPDSFARAQETLVRRQKLQLQQEHDREEKKHHALRSGRGYEANESGSAAIDCPPSPDDNQFKRREQNKSPMASPTSPRSRCALGSQEQIFPSDPSLPALVSGSSSVSADTDCGFLQPPLGIRMPESLMSTGDTITPPSLSKHSTNVDRGSTESVPMQASGEPFVMDADGKAYSSNSDPDQPRPLAADDGDDSDSDEGLTMGRKKFPQAKGHVGRRGTDASVASTETAKKVSMAEWNSLQ